MSGEIELSIKKVLFASKIIMQQAVAQEVIILIFGMVILLQGWGLG